MKLRIRTFLASGAVVALAGVGLSMGTASANPKISNLVQTAGPNPVVVDINAKGFQNPTTLATVTNEHSVNITLALDSNCPSALDTPSSHGTYGVTPGSLGTNGTVAPVGNVDSLKCGDTATFKITGGPTPTSNTGVTLTFLPVASAPGQSKKLGSFSITVIVTDQAGTSTSSGGSSQGNPAAPAVANTYLNGNNFATCPAYAKKRGSLMNQVAAAMPKPESIKDDDAFWDAHNLSWQGYVVQDIVLPLCNGGTPVPVSAL